MLLTKRVVVKINSNSLKHYLNLGYSVPTYYNKHNKRNMVKKGTPLLVDVWDLTDRSSTRVEVECDGEFCPKGIISIAWANYKRNVQPSGEYYCKFCAMGKFARSKTTETMLEKNGSFAKWAISNVDENFIDKYWGLKNKIDPFQITVHSQNKIWIKCQDKYYHGEYLVSCGSFFRGDRCSYCSHTRGKVHPKDSLGQYLKENNLLNIYSANNKKDSFEYSVGSGVKTNWLCEKHGEYERSIKASFIYMFRCPMCSSESQESTLQEKVRKYISSFGYTVNHENRCSLYPDNPFKNISAKGSKKLRYDNEIIFSNNNRLFIEVNGEAHYKINYFHILAAKFNGTTPEYEFQYQQEKDEYKRQHVIDNGYQFLEIPHWYDNKNEDWKHAIDNVINNILLTI